MKIKSQYKIWDERTIKFWITSIMMVCVWIIKQLKDFETGWKTHISVTKNDKNKIQKNTL